MLTLKKKDWNLEIKLRKIKVKGYLYYLLKTLKILA
jgi:hypothetical protein